MAIKIGAEQMAAIKKHSEAAYTNECCGFLLGQVENGEKTVVSTMSAPNAREEAEQHHRFLITPEAFMQTDKIAREKGLEIIGFYHSHPNAEARPSQYDLEHGWPWYSYIIVSVAETSVGNVTSWLMKDDRSQFDQEEIVLK